MAEELETIESVNILRAIPHASQLSGVPEGMYTLRHEVVGVIERKDLERLMRESGKSEEEVRDGMAFHDDLMQKKYELVLGGYTVDDGWERSSAGMSGMVPAERIGHFAHPGEVGLGINMNASGKGQEKVNGARVFIHAEIASNAPIVRGVYDAVSKVKDMIVPGRMVEIRGDHLVIAGPNETVIGIFFTAQSGGTPIHIGAEECVPNDPGLIRFVLPPNVPMGNYQMSLATQWTNHKGKYTANVRTCVYERPVQVSMG